MRLKYLLLGVAFALTAASVGEASSATVPATFVGSTFNYLSTAKPYTSASVVGPARPYGATITGVKALANPDLVYSNQFNGIGKSAVDIGDALSAVGLTPQASGYHFNPAGVPHHSASDPQGRGHETPGNFGMNLVVAVSEIATWGMMVLGVALMAIGLQIMREERGRSATDESFYVA
jgi:hypothetical protein